MYNCIYSTDRAWEATPVTNSRKIKSGIDTVRDTPAFETVLLG
jgi:hypothetical protein